MIIYKVRSPAGVVVIEKPKIWTEIEIGIIRQGAAVIIEKPVRTR